MQNYKLRGGIITFLMFFLSLGVVNAQEMTSFQKFKYSKESGQQNVKKSSSTSASAKSKNTNQNKNQAQVKSGNKNSTSKNNVSKTPSNKTVAKPANPKSSVNSTQKTTPPAPSYQPQNAKKQVIREYAGGAISFTTSKYSFGESDKSRYLNTLLKTDTLKSLKSEIKSIETQITSEQAMISFYENMLYGSDENNGLIQLSADLQSQINAGGLDPQTLANLQNEINELQNQITNTQNAINASSQNINALKEQKTEVEAQILVVEAENQKNMAIANDVTNLKTSGSGKSFLLSAFYGAEISHKEFIFGAEAGIELGKIKIGGGANELEVSSNFALFLTGKVGYELSKTLTPFAYLGLSRRNYDISHKFGETRFESSETINSLTFGVGIERKINQNITVFGQYGKSMPISSPTLSSINAKLKIESDELKVGLKYYF